MGLIKWSVVVSVIAGLGYYLSSTGENPAKPDIKDGWFGRGEQRPDDTNITEFRINITDAVISDLKRRLDTTRLGEDLENNANFHYGVNTATLQNVLDYWRGEYDWRKHEAILNQFPQFKTQIEGIDVHFLRVKPKSKGISIGLD